MKLGSMFNEPRTLAQKAKKKQSMVRQDLPNKGSQEKKRQPGPFIVDWPKKPKQEMKVYQPILNKADLKAYLLRCQETGIAGFDWETAADQRTRDHYEPQLQELQDAINICEDKDELRQLEKQYNSLLGEFHKTPLDPWKGEISTVSVSAKAHESRVVPISHRKGKVFEPELSREDARQLVLDMLDLYLFKNRTIIKIAVNLSFETKYAAKYAKYIMQPVADPLVMWVRCMQMTKPHMIKNPKKPASGWGLKPMTKYVFGVEQGNFVKLLEKHKADFFDEIPADHGDGLQYSAEDADYAVQHYEYWMQIVKQIPKYEQWLHDIEMPFQRVIGLMEYWGMAWDSNVAQEKEEEAINMQEVAADNIRKTTKETLNIDVNPGKSGKTKEVKSVIFDQMKLPASKYGKTGPSLDKESLIDMKFMLENKLQDLEEEKYLAVELPEDWENRDPETDAKLTKAERMGIRIKQREFHPYKDAGIQLLDELKKIQSYTTLLSSHIVGRAKYVNEVSGRIHASYTSWTETSRLNSFHPNGQNVPRPDNDVFLIRNFYRAPEGKVLFLIDFSGFELRIIAWKSNDETMIHLFSTGGDMHRRTASVMTGKAEEDVTKKERTDAKPGNFGITYGGTEHSLQTTFKVDYEIRKTLDECYQIVKAVKTAYPGIPRYQREIVVEAREKGYAETVFGYKRLLPGINSSNRYSRQSADRQAGNTPIQGSAADLMKRAQNRVYDEIGKGTADPENAVLCHGKTDMIGQIHDEILFEMDDDPDVVEAAYHKVKEIMELPPFEGFPIPIIAEASSAYSWGEKIDTDDWLKKKRGEVDGH